MNLRSKLPHDRLKRREVANAADMRQQYHSRFVGDRLLIWDVTRLVRITASLPRRKVPLSQIRELNEDFWFHGQTNGVTCRQVAEHAKLIEETDLKYPIILSQNGRVMDGMHRVAKAFMEGRTDLDAVQFDVDPDPDYVDVDVDSLPY